MRRSISRHLHASLALALLAGCNGDDNASASEGSSDSNITSASAGQTTSTSDASSTSTSDSASGSASASASASGTSTSTSGPDTSTSTSGPDTTSTTGVITDSSTSEGSSGSTTDGQIEPCQVEETPIEPIPSDILFVLDKSGSMSMEQWDHDNNLQTPNVTRWKSLHSVVESVVTKFDDKLNFGAKLYPKIDAGSFIDQGACEISPGIEVPVAPKNAMAILAGIPGPDFDVLGGTPSFQALEAGFTYLKGLKTGYDAAVIFITDGEISCDNPPAAAIAEISDAWEVSKIPTYVVGIDVDAVTSAQLNQFASAGGRALPGQTKFYKTTDQIELAAAMQLILDDTISCVLPVDPEPAYPELFEVWVDGAEVDLIGDCAKESGWHWTKEHTEIELCGAACTALKQGDGIEAKYFCMAG